MKVNIWQEVIGRYAGMDQNWRKTVKSAGWMFRAGVFLEHGKH